MSSAPSVRLSCELCNQRKIRCDKHSPCTNCRKSGAVCVPVERRRWPRGLSGKLAISREEELRDRVARLEKLLQNSAYPARRTNNASNSSTDDTCPGDLPTAFSQPTTSYDYHNRAIAPDVMRPENGYFQPKRSKQENLMPMGAYISSLGSLVTDLRSTENVFSSLTSQQEPRKNLEDRKTLLQVFLVQVDPIVKILHSPSLSAYILDGKPYLGYDSGHAAPAALASAVFYAAGCSMSEEQCFSLLNVRKESTIAKYKKDTEAALERAELILTNDLTVLQAFVLSLVAARSHDHSRRTWTMLSIALRIAQALSLHIPDPPFPVSPFERELRTRLWHLLGWLDIQASMDRTSEPLMQSSWFQFHSISNIDDSEFGLHSAALIPAEIGETTQTTLFLILTHAQCAMRVLDLSKFAEPGVCDVHIRMQVVKNFDQYTKKFIAKCDSDRIALHWFIKSLRERICTILLLVALRPLHQNPDFIPLKMKPSRLLHLAAKILEGRKRMYRDPRVQPWRWTEPLFFPWHALTVALTELCACAEPPVMAEYWPVVENGFNCFLELVVDLPQNIFWKPIENMMRQARAVRDNLLSYDPPNPEFPIIDAELAVQPPIISCQESWPSQVLYPAESGEFVTSIERGLTGEREKSVPLWQPVPATSEGEEYENVMSEVYGAYSSIWTNP